MKSKGIDISTEEVRQEFYNTHPTWATVVAKYVSKVTNHETKIWFRETSIYGILYMEDVASGTVVTKKIRTNGEIEAITHP